MCEAELENVRPREVEGAQEMPVREKLALIFRREKARSEKEVILLHSRIPLSNAPSVAAETCKHGYEGVYENKKVATRLVGTWQTPEGNRSRSITNG